MMRLTDIAAAINPVSLLRPTSDLNITRVSSDSRHCGPQSLFVALKGENNDGHDYIDQAIVNGAAAVLYTQGRWSSDDNKHVAAFAVADSDSAYRQLATAWRHAAQQRGCRIVAVSGSVGKTTCKELIAAICNTANPGAVIHTAGSQNGFAGIPATLFRINEHTKVAVIEVGIDGPGAMIQHMHMVRPDVSLLTAISPEHLTGFGDFATVIREELLALQEPLKHNAAIIINLDDREIGKAFADCTAANAWFFSIAEAKALPQTRRLIGHYHPDTQTLRVGDKTIPLPVPGRHNAGNTLATMAVARALGISETNIEHGLKSFVAPFGRSQMKQLNNGCLVICDYYNASPESVVAGLATLRDISSDKPMWVVLGDMLELGADEEQYHRNLATDILALNPEGIVLFGERMRWLYDELQHRGASAKARHFTAVDQAARHLQSIVTQPVAVLAKASRGIALERLFKGIVD